MESLFNCVLNHPWVALYIAILLHFIVSGIGGSIVKISKSWTTKNED